jgi:hypothetical protein
LVRTVFEGFCLVWTGRTASWCVVVEYANTVCPVRVSTFPVEE